MQCRPLKTPPRQVAHAAGAGVRVLVLNGSGLPCGWLDCLTSISGAAFIPTSLFSSDLVRGVLGLAVDADEKRGTFHRSADCSVDSLACGRRIVRTMESP